MQLQDGKLIHIEAFNRCFSYDIYERLVDIQQLLTADPSGQEAINEYGQKIVNAFINKDLAIIYDEYLSSDRKFQSFRTSDDRQLVNIDRLKLIIMKYNGNDNLDLFHHPNLAKIMFEYYSIHERYITPIGIIAINYDCRESFALPPEFTRDSEYQQYIKDLYDTICPSDNCLFQ
jgi:hypothetical protein